MRLMRIPIGRAESRVPLTAPLWVTSLTDPDRFELVTTENVSQRGARVAVRQQWQPHEGVLLSSPRGFRARASIIYCQRYPNEGFAAGVRLERAAESWFANLERAATS